MQGIYEDMLQYIISATLNSVTVLGYWGFEGKKFFSWKVKCVIFIAENSFGNLNLSAPPQLH